MVIVRCYFIFYQFPYLFWHFEYCNRKLLTTYHSTKSVTYLLVNIHHDHLLKCFIQYKANCKPHFSFCVSRELFFFWSFYCITFRSYKRNIFLISLNLLYSRLIDIIWHSTGFQHQNHQMTFSTIRLSETYFHCRKI